VSTGEAQSWDSDMESLAAPSVSPLLQSWAWGDVQAKAGWSVERVRLKDAMASVQIRGIGGVREAYVPRGPVPATPEAIERLTEWARERRAARLRIEPDASPELAEALRAQGFSPVSPVQPADSVIVDMKSPDELLKTFRHGRRYNIRAGLRRGTVAEEGRDGAELERQSAAVERRESISLPGQGYYDLLLNLLPWCRTYVARHSETKEALAAVLVARHAGRGYSLFAGRTGKHPELMGNDVAWWSAISSCAESGCREFDLWGVPPPGSGPDHPWHGLGAFKAEFSGRHVAYAGAWEIVLSKTGARLLALEKSARSRVRGLKRNIS
jgi:lipid II:glycine glycyltransferase (peptidoglycan interpeptide bridge formation enzyme)